MTGSAQLLQAAYRAALDAAEKPGELGPTIAGVRAAMRVVLTDLDALLHPENYPGRDPDHVFWSRGDPTAGEIYDDRLGQIVVVPEAFQWDSETIEWVDDWVTALLAHAA